jgi:hypothetical protein
MFLVVHFKAVHGQTKHVVVSTSYTAITSLSNDTPMTGRNATAVLHDQSMLRPQWNRTFTFADEIHYMRNAETSAQVGALQRITVKSCFTVGATATPLWNNPLDIIGELQAILVRVIRSGKSSSKSHGSKRYSQWSNWISDCRKQWTKLQNQRSTAIKTVEQSQKKKPIGVMPGEERERAMERGRLRSNR